MGRRRERSGKWREILLEIPKIDNGSIMRLAPVVLAFATSPSEAIAMAARSSRTTHGARDAVDGCRRATVRAGPAIGRRLQFGGSRAKRGGLLWTCGIAPRGCLTTRSGQIVPGSRRRARRNGADGDGARLPIEFALDALDGADADVMLGGELADAGAALLQGVPDFALDGDRDRWPAETLALGASTSKAGVNSVLDDAALELGEDAHHLEQRLAAGRRGVHALLMEIQVDLQGMQLGQERDQVLQRPAKSINRPGHDDVELAPGRALAQGVESGPPIS